MTQPSPLKAAMIQPLQQEKLPPCSAACASGSDVRGWIGIVAQRHKLGLSTHEAFRRAWDLLAAVNPFPATLGRICPHPCEAGCNRTVKEGGIAINALERFLGDWALREGVGLPRLAPNGSRPESVGVIGAGPAGLSFGYQMVRRGYYVTMYEQAERPGGMLYYGIPQYRLPERVLAAEVNRILEFGVNLRLGTRIGVHVSVEQLRRQHDLLFLGIGAGSGLKLGIPGEDGPGVWTGTEFLAQENRGERVELGTRVIVVGGGNTALDAARVARRRGAGVMMLYRRTRSEMPAIAAEVDDALAEGVTIEFLAAPVSIRRQDGTVRAVVVRRMELGEPDASGRRSAVPIQGSDYEVEADSVIAAVSQQPDWEGLGELQSGKVWADAPDGRIREDLWTGGDSLGLGLAAEAIYQGRQAAEAVHARLRGLRMVPPPEQQPIPPSAVRPDYYLERPRVAPDRKDADFWRTDPDAELQATISESEFLEETSRCFSCGSCFGCEQCFMYCNAGGFVRLKEVGPGAYFALRLERCEACSQCTTVCPCGFLSPR